MNYWIIKTDPEKYSWSDLERDKTTIWDGVRNFEARNNLGKMDYGDLAYVYHSIQDKCIVGIVEISKIAFPDPTSADSSWLAVGIKIIEKIVRANSFRDSEKSSYIAEYFFSQAFEIIGISN